VTGGENGAVVTRPAFGITGKWTTRSPWDVARVRARRWWPASLILRRIHAFTVWHGDCVDPRKTEHAGRFGLVAVERERSSPWLSGIVRWPGECSTHQNNRLSPRRTVCSSYFRRCGDLQRHGCIGRGGPIVGAGHILLPPRSLGSSSATQFPYLIPLARHLYALIIFMPQGCRRYCGAGSINNGCPGALARARRID